MSAMKYYAMVAINGKTASDGGGLKVRRVLISYTHRQGPVFCDTKFLEKDEYFYDKNSSHQYEFFDDGYMLTAVNGRNEIGESVLLGCKRQYHSDFDESSPMAPILFKAAMDVEAINKFKHRTEER